MIDWPEDAERIRLSFCQEMPLLANLNRQLRAAPNNHDLVNGNVFYVFQVPELLILIECHSKPHILIAMKGKRIYKERHNRRERWSTPLSQPSHACCPIVSQPPSRCEGLDRRAEAAEHSSLQLSSSHTCGCQNTIIT